MIVIQNLEHGTRPSDKWHAGIASPADAIGYLTRNPYRYTIAQSQDAEVFVHELAHVWFALGDEYNYAVSASHAGTYDNCDYVDCPKWQDLVAANLADCLADSCYDGRNFRSTEFTVMRQHGSTTDFGKQSERIICCKCALVFGGAAPTFCNVFTNPALGLDLMKYCEENLSIASLFKIPDYQLDEQYYDTSSSSSSSSSFLQRALVKVEGMKARGVRNLRQPLDTMTAAANGLAAVVKKEIEAKAAEGVAGIQAPPRADQLNIKNRVDFDKQGARFVTCDKRLFPNGIRTWQIAKKTTTSETADGKSKSSWVCEPKPEHKNLRTGEPMSNKLEYGTCPYYAVYGDDVHEDKHNRIQHELLSQSGGGSRKYLKVCIREGAFGTKPTESKETDPNCDKNYYVTFFQEDLQVLEGLHEKEDGSQGEKSVVVRQMKNKIELHLDAEEQCEMLETDLVADHA
ncbi:unnamed protein product [Amoebophrya sp. A120]|nr:unnamed protein product [Amoebophrya sp. A120]|eukprot:GSA120T00007210001.1